MLDDPKSISRPGSSTYGYFIYSAKSPFRPNIERLYLEENLSPLLGIENTYWYDSYSEVIMQV